MKNKIYIRADGSSEIGLGHIIRCLALAKMLKDDFSIHFVSKAIPDHLKNVLINNGFSLISISSEDEFLTQLSGEEIVVLDHYELDSDYQQRIKKIGSKLVCIDDLHNKEFFADLIINHSPGISPDDYIAQKYTKYALGPGYALLRPVFLEATGSKKTIEAVKNVLICFGGSDFNNLTKSVLQVVDRNDRIDKITVILGSAYPYRESLNGIAENNPKIRILSSLDERSMLSEINNADLAIIPSSGILFEVIAGGTLPLICFYAENQRELFNYFKSRELLPSFDAANFNEKHLNSVISDILNKKVHADKIPFRNEIKESSSNNLNNFKELVNE